MDERAVHQERGTRRRAASALGRISLAQPARGLGSMRPAQLGAMDELVVDPRQILRLVLRRRAMKLAAGACLMATPWCREQRLLAPNHVLRWEIETALLSSLGRGFVLSAQLTAFLLKVKPRASATTDAEAPVERAATDALAQEERSRRMTIRPGRARRSGAVSSERRAFTWINLRHRAWSSSVVRNW